MTRIAIDYTPAYEQGGGIGRLVRDLVYALANYDTETDYRLFVAGVANNAMSTPPGNNFTWRTTQLSPTWLARIWHRLKVPLKVEAFTDNIDLYHATNFVLPPTRKHTKTIVTVHDLSFIRVPEAATPRLKAYLNAVVPLSIKRADHIIADSAATQKDLIELYRIKPEKISVLLSGVNECFRPIDDLTSIQDKYNLPEGPYIFSVGTVQPRKNYERVVDSLARLRAAKIDIDLVIAGGKGWLEGPLYRKIEETGLTEHVHMLGFVHDEDLPALYSGANCVAFPSLYEGFGFPVLESMACGTPVITSNISSLPEVAGEAALMVNPKNTDELVYALRRVIEDQTLREKMIADGFQQAAKFTWQASAQSLVRIYREVLS